MSKRRLHSSFEVQKGEMLSAALAEEILLREGKNRPRWVKIWRKTLSRIRPLGGGSSGNVITLFHEGDAAFFAMLSAIDAAQKRVWLETYIFANDALGLQVRAALYRAQKRGVSVRVLVDGFGSGSLPRHFFKDLVAAGADVVTFNPLLPFRFSRPVHIQKSNAWTTRDHRKLIFIDDKIAFLGGMNVSSDYAGSQLGNGSFRDTHLRIIGPCAIDVGNLILDSLRQTIETSVENVEFERIDCSDCEKGERSMVQLLSSNARRGRRQIQRTLRQCVSRSLDVCYLTSPYFVPPRRLLYAMASAARRGVDVRVLTAGKSDVPMSRWAGEAVYVYLLRRGVRIYELQSKNLHAKTAAVDGIYSLVGSFNLDSWSYRRNLEVSLGMVNAEITVELQTQFLADLENAREIKLYEVLARSFYARARSWFSYQLLR